MSSIIIIPVAVIVGVLVLLAFVFAFRRSLLPWAKKHVSSPTAGIVASQASAQNLTAEQLASSSTRPRPPPGSGTTPVPSNAGRANGGRQNRRNVRRTESGNSVKTLPEYSKVPGDQELVLVRQRSASIISEAEDEASDQGDIADAAERSLLPSTGAVRADSINRNSLVARADSRRSVRSVHEDASEEAVQEVDRPTSPFPAPQSAPAGSTISRAIGSLARRGWGEAPTYLEAMSSPDFRDVEARAGIPPPRDASPLTRNRSGFRDFLSRAGLAPSSFRAPNRLQSMSQRPGSSTSLLLQPQVSRLTTHTSPSSRYASPWASTHSLNISSPVPNTAVRASFDMPRAGLSDEQMRYIGSSEAVNVAGVKLSDPPAGRRRRTSEDLTYEGSPGPDGEDRGAPPPSWAQVDDERRRNEAEFRKGLARPVGQEDERGAADARPVGEEEHRAEAETEGEVGEQREMASQSTQTVGRAKLERPILAVSAPSVDIEVEPPTPILPDSETLSIR